MDYVGLGRRIRKQRLERQMTQENLAVRAGISLSFLGHIERGTRKASLETIVSIANVLNTGIDCLMADSLSLQQNEEGPLAHMPSGRKRLVLNELSRIISENLDVWSEDEE